MGYWSEQLRGHKPENVEADAKALADLFLINSRLKTTNTRCVFITGDRGLVRQAYGRIPLRLVPPEDVELATSFSLLFVRHLWAFLSDALVDPSNEDLYAGLLARWSEPRNIPREQLERLIKSDDGDTFASFEGVADVEEILKQWDALTHKSVRQYGFNKVGNSDRLRHAIWDRVAASSHLDWDRLVPLLREDVDRVRDRTVLAMSDLGIEAIFRAAKLGKRNPPELIFDSLKNTNHIFRRLSSVPGYESARQFELDFAKIREDCHVSMDDGDDRQESHLKFLVLAAAFASADKWMIALSHAKRAISIIERSRSDIPVRHKGTNGGPKSHMSGREAYFLAASAQRILAVGEFDLLQSSQYLSLAREALIQDHARRTAAGITTSRFQNEDVALRLSRYYLARRMNPADLQSPLVEALFRSAEPLVDEFDGWQSPEGAPVSQVTAVGVATNLIQTFVINEFRQTQEALEYVSCPVRHSHVEKAVIWIDKLSSWQRGASAAVIATRLISTYAWVGVLLTSTVASKESDGALEVLGALLRDAAAGGVTVYDSWRYQALRDFVDNWARSHGRPQQTG